jgi:hypothetical protein
MNFQPTEARISTKAHLSDVFFYFSTNPARDYLYYKERRQLKTFLSQFSLALPLTPDPPVRLYDD